MEASPASAFSLGFWFGSKRLTASAAQPRGTSRSPLQLETRKILLKIFHGQFPGTTGGFDLEIEISGAAQLGGVSARAEL